MYLLYHDDDFHILAERREESIEIQGKSVPYVIFENEDDVTSARGEALGQRLEESLSLLWQRWQKISPAGSS